jgi:glycosyltransferase involved in cell wall biosynthesis
MSAPLFTVFTPTYNRAHTLGRVYLSLLSQTFSDFEWLIVDDGSTDGTTALVNSFIADRKIVIRYIQQPNGGKHVAFNRGVREAHGYLFLPFDSDDSCIPTTLEQFHAGWYSISDEKRSHFSGVTCLCMNERDEVVGSSFPLKVLDGKPYEITSKYQLKGEKWGFHRTAILEQYPFPEFPDERFVPEGLIWNRIGGNYKIRFINVALRRYYVTSNSLSSASVKIRILSPRATSLYYSEAMKLSTKLGDRLKAAANLWRFSIGSGNPRYALLGIDNPAIFFFGFLPGLTLAILDKAKE